MPLPWRGDRAGGDCEEHRKPKARGKGCAGLDAPRETGEMAARLLPALSPRNGAPNHLRRNWRGPAFRTRSSPRGPGGTLEAGSTSR